MKAYRVLIIDAAGSRHDTTVLAASAQAAEDIAIAALGVADAPRWVRTRRA